MNDRIEKAIAEYLRARSGAQLMELDCALLEEDFYVPVGAPIREISPGRFDIPAICIRTEVGLGAIPAFTSLEQLRTWKPLGCEYTVLSGQKLIRMAKEMSEVSEIIINVGGAPHGVIPRSDFSRMLAL